LISGLPESEDERIRYGPANFLTPRRLPIEPRLFFVEPAPFLWASKAAEVEKALLEV
jgi:hypothetical protein